MIDFYIHSASSVLPTSLVLGTTDLAKSMHWYQTVLGLSASPKQWLASVPCHCVAMASCCQCVTLLDSEPRFVKADLEGKPAVSILPACLIVEPGIVGIASKTSSNPASGQVTNRENCPITEVVSDPSGHQLLLIERQTATPDQNYDGLVLWYRSLASGEAVCTSLLGIGSQGCFSRTTIAQSTITLDQTRSGLVIKSRDRFQCSRSFVRRVLGSLAESDFWNLPELGPLNDGLDGVVYDVRVHDKAHGDRTMLFSGSNDASQAQWRKIERILVHLLNAGRLEIQIKNILSRIGF